VGWAEEQEDEEGGDLGELSEGGSYKDRAVSLLEHGFVCECSRCCRKKDEDTRNPIDCQFKLRLKSHSYLSNQIQ